MPLPLMGIAAGVGAVSSLFGAHQADKSQRAQMRLQRDQLALQKEALANQQRMQDFALNRSNQAYQHALNSSVNANKAASDAVGDYRQSRSGVAAQNTTRLARMGVKPGSMQSAWQNKNRMVNNAINEAKIRRDTFKQTKDSNFNRVQGALTGNASAYGQAGTQFGNRAAMFGNMATASGTAASAAGQQMGSALGGLGRIGSAYAQSQYKPQGKLAIDTTATGAQSKAQGGLIEGAGTDTSDSIPAKLSHGEYVVPADVVRQLGSNFFDKLVAKHNHSGQEPPQPQPQQAFAQGGYVHKPYAPKTSLLPDIINYPLRKRANTTSSTASSRG